MSAVPDGWQVGARLRNDYGTEGTIVYVGKQFAVLEADKPYDPTAYYGDPCWELVLPFPPIPEDVGTVIQDRSLPTWVAVRKQDGWALAGRERSVNWKPDPAEWQQMIPKEKQQ